MFEMQVSLDVRHDVDAKISSAEKLWGASDASPCNRKVLQLLLTSRQQTCLHERADDEQ
jgi:hypothetical protein